MKYYFRIVNDEKGKFKNVLSVYDKKIPEVFSNEEEDDDFFDKHCCGSIIFKTKNELNEDDLYTIIDEVLPKFLNSTISKYDKDFCIILNITQENDENDDNEISVHMDKILTSSIPHGTTQFVIKTLDKMEKV